MSGRVGGASASRVAGDLGGAPALRPHLASWLCSAAGSGHLRHPRCPRPHCQLKAATVCWSRRGLESRGGVGAGAERVVVLLPCATQAPL